jgi:WD40 repeat protein
VIDVARGDQLIAYDNCAFNGRDRTGLAADPLCPNMAVCVCVNGKGLTLFDLRMPLPLDFIYDLHNNIIRDVQFLHDSWPWVGNHQRALLSVSCDGVCKVTTLDGRALHCFEAGHAVNSITPTPERYSSCLEDGFCSVMMLGGDLVSAYVPDMGIQEKLADQKDSPVWKCKYTSNGSQLYTVCDRGVVRRYRRYPDRHEFLGEVFSHKGDIQDIDISPYDEYLITASKDRSVGVLQLGTPNHGWTEYSELT